MQDFKPARFYSLSQLQRLDLSLKHQVRTQGVASEFIDTENRLLYLKAIDADESVLVDLTRAMKIEQITPGAYFQVFGEYGIDSSRTRPMIAAQFLKELQFIQCNIDYYQYEMLKTTVKIEQLTRRFNY
mmetsp:Transcript_32981/g.57964  ORF Transcript_32981/g.57964 Transcript_32981/m.57964 type:complete len:129 (+) Transcript_32981:536-922(+)